jgi:hypothetical protein
MSAIRTWYVTHQDAITWFVIGWVSSAGLDELARGNYVWGAVLLGLAFVNYSFRKIRVD